MLHCTLATVLSRSICEAERMLQPSWTPLLQVKDVAQTLLCCETQAFLEAQLAKNAGPTDDVPIFTIVYVAALHAIHSGLAAPVQWTTARDSPFRTSMPSKCLSPTGTEAAQVIAGVCERILLASAETANAYFSQLLHESGMGIPLLALVLRAYAEVAVDILPGNSEDTKYPQSCIDHLLLATHSLTEATSDDALTIAHPILLHVARVSGRTQEAMQLLGRPTYRINPLLTGIGLSDYVAYYAEAALVLAAHKQYASATYVISPLSQLLLTCNTRKSKTEGGSKEKEAEVPTWLETVEENEEGAGGGDANLSRASVTGSSASSSAQPQVLLYPWYRTERIGETHQYTSAVETKDGGAGVNTAISKGVSVPSAVERRIGRRAVAWANRLGIVLLAAAFGGGNPRGTMALIESARRPPLENKEAPSMWSGMESEIPGHVCFPNPLFSLLTETTPISLYSLLPVAVTSKEPSTRAYTDLLRAIARRDKASAEKCLSAAANVAVFTADLTLDLVRATIMHQLPRHIVLDMSRMYAHVPMQLLLDRIQLTLTDAQTSEEMVAEKIVEVRRKTSDTVKVDIRLALVRLLAEMCATGELASCHMCTASPCSPGAAVGTQLTPYTIEEAVRKLNKDTSWLVVDTASVKWTLPSRVTLLQRCTQIVELQVNQGPTCTLPVPSAQLLEQLQELRKVVDADTEDIRGMQTA